MASQVVVLEPRPKKEPHLIPNFRDTSCQANVPPCPNKGKKGVRHKEGLAVLEMRISEDELTPQKDPHWAVPLCNQSNSNSSPQGGSK